MSLEETDKECAANAVAPRVALADIENAIEREFYFTGGEAARAFDRMTAREHRVLCAQMSVSDAYALREKADSTLDPLTICIVVLHNGFSVIGKAAPASPQNFNAELGRKLAREDAVRQLWPLMGFALRERLHTSNPAGDRMTAGPR